IEETKNEVLGLLRKNLRPEFLNRIDEIIMFRPLTQKQIKDVVRIQMNNVAKTLEANDILISTTDEAINELARIGYDPTMGARPVKRVIQKEILNELSREILEEKINRSDNIVIDVFDGKFVFYNAK
ncbi:MAG: type VI secretion system ATPase TssH, partial [Bacteroidales bacterium]|nr:type VI secretion system ATPase TssH [Bacteroidales bacterium]